MCIYIDVLTCTGLNVLRLLNETAATALGWGLPRTMDLPEDSATPRHVLFFDMGHGSTQVYFEPRKPLNPKDALLRHTLNPNQTRKTCSSDIGLTSATAVCGCVDAGVSGGLHQGQDDCAGYGIRPKPWWSNT